MSVSVLTLVRGRQAHLHNLMVSLRHQSLLPDEMVIAWMQPKPFDVLPALPFPVRHIHVEGEELPLAAARNAAARASTSDGLVFLDVDCIASPTVVASYSKAIKQADGIFMSEVFYLPAQTSDFDGDCTPLDIVGERHVSKRPFHEDGIEEEPDSGQLWGLSFALRKNSWRSLGGMDERFIGYGGEETDFAASAARAGLRTYRVGSARVYHQHHMVSIPPFEHFKSIIRNATLFREKHGRWCMDYWLGQFHDAGLIDWPRGDQSIRVLRAPDQSEIDAARQPGNVLYS